MPQPLQIQLDPAQGVKWRELHIDVTTEGERSELYPDDRVVPGYYSVQVPANLDDEMAAACAMAKFHWTVPIKRISDFDYVVLDPVNDVSIEPLPAADCAVSWDALSELAGSLECIEHYMCESLEDCYDPSDETD